MKKSRMKITYCLQTKQKMCKIYVILDEWILKEQDKLSHVE